MDRLKDWDEFSKLMERHIERYTIPQYQSNDGETDQVGAFTSEECILNIKRYVNRYGKNVRGNLEAMRDMFKIAHYAQFAYNKLKEELGGEIYK